MRGTHTMSRACGGTHTANDRRMRGIHAPHGRLTRECTQRCAHLQRRKARPAQRALVHPRVGALIETCHGHERGHLHRGCERTCGAAVARRRAPAHPATHSPLPRRRAHARRVLRRELRAPVGRQRRQRRHQRAEPKPQHARATAPVWRRRRRRPHVHRAGRARREPAVRQPRPHTHIARGRVINEPAADAAAGDDATTTHIAAAAAAAAAANDAAGCTPLNRGRSSDGDSAAEPRRSRSRRRHARTAAAPPAVAGVRCPPAPTTQRALQQTKAHSSCPERAAARRKQQLSRAASSASAGRKGSPWNVPFLTFPQWRWPRGTAGRAAPAAVPLTASEGS